MFKTHVHERSQDSAAAKRSSKTPDKHPNKRAKRSKKRAKRSKKSVRAKSVRAEDGVICFNSKSTEYIELADGRRAPICKLSNFYGGAEFEYMQDRFHQREMLDLLSMLEECDGATFLAWLKRLQPEKEWTEGQEKYWFLKKEPIRGILAKEPIRGKLAQLIGTVVRDGPTARDRKVILLKYFAEQGTPLESIETKDELSDVEKQGWMKVCLRHKFAVPEYRDLLLATGDAILHEKPMRGSPNAWSYKWHKDPKKRGGDWLGKLLMEVRAEIRDN